MGADAVDWLPALVVLAVGLAGGVLLAWRIRSAARAVAPSATPSLELRDLAARRDGLLQQLRELEDTAAKRTPEQLAEERYGLELETARVLRDLEARSVAGPAVKAPATPRPAQLAGTPAPAVASPLRGFLWGAGSMAVLGLLFFLVWQSARPREEGGTLTGNLPQQSAAPADPEEARLREAVARNPDDLEARLELARVHLRRQDMMAVFEETRYVLERSPGQPRALGYQALVRLAMGQSEQALGMLKQALAASPGFFEGYVHLMLVYVRMGRLADAEATAADAARRFPEQAQRLRDVLAQMKAEVPAEQTRAAEGEADPHAGLPAPPGAVAAAPSPAAASAAPAPAGAGPTLDVEIDLDPSLRGQVAPGSVLFLIVREAGLAKGPPRAVKRLQVGTFPVRVRLDEADSMAGEPLPREARVEARADADGDPMTRPSSDPSAAQDAVKTGAGLVRLVLKR